LYAFTSYLHANLSSAHFTVLVRSVVTVMAIGMVGALTIATMFGSE
jgi:hypothetical protein